MTTEQSRQQFKEDTAATLEDRMQSAEGGEFSGVSETVEEEEINLPGQLLPGGGLRLSNTPDTMPGFDCSAA